MRAFHRSALARLAVLAPLASSLAFSPSVAAQDDVRTSRELSGIAEEQALLRRQLSRLKQTMEILIGTLEKEGRTRAVELLREGVTLLDERPDDSGALTLEEMMDQARARVESGQVVHSLEAQELVVSRLERLLSILMDRENLESLEESIEELEKLRAELGELAERENDLRKDTADLREESMNDAQRDLLEQLAEAIEEQSELLSENESQGRESGLFDLDAYKKAMRELLEDQRVDASVLDSWSPEQTEALAGARSSLEEARRAEADAARMRAAAEALREAADEASAPAGDPQAAAGELEDAAEREERHGRASGDPKAAEAAAALRRAAEALKNAGNDAAARAEAADEARTAAEELDRTAAEAAAEASEAREGTTAELGELAGEPTAAGATAERAKQALERAQEAARAGAANEAAEATEEAARALAEGVEEQQFLPRALSESQNEMAERAERLGRGLESLPQSEEERVAAAREKLAEAAEAMSEASAEAREGDQPGASQQAEAAAQALEEALNKLSEAQQKAAAETREGVGELSAQQESLARDAQQMQASASQGSMSPEAQSQVQESLERAQQSMEQAAEQLSEGQSSDAAQSQRDALEELSKAQQAAQKGTTPQTEEQQQKAEELADQQEEIRKDLLELAKRIEERKNATPVPSLEKASQSAKNAEEALDRGSFDEAEQEEADTEREIREAMDQLEEEEDQYQRLRQEELLFRIIEEVQNLTEKHREQMDATRELDAQREIGDRPTRAQRLRLRRIAREEGALSERAGELSAAILEEGSLVFAEVLAQCQQDLDRVSRDMDEEGGYRSGERVQARQEDVEEALVWLAEALKEEQRRREEEQQEQEGDQQQPPGDQEQRIVPDEAELKLLRRFEVDVQERIERTLLLYPELSELATEDVDPLVLEDVMRLATRHERLTDLFTQFRKRLGIPDPGASEEVDTGHEHEEHR